ncbi:MAG: DUF1887 family protein [Bernardetiaceae bacterium]|nr:DUF1887 family protein [Bernardetiaceae bacterium]
MPTLISLTSAQTLPNVLFAKSGTKQWDRYIFVSTDFMEGQHKTEHILQVLGLDRNAPNVIIKQVLEDSLEDISLKLSNIEFHDDEEITVNLTGGTKIMAIGVYNFFVRKSCKMFYIPFPKNEIVQVFPEIKSKVQVLDYRVNLLEYLQTYDVKVSQASFQQKNHTFSEAITQNMFRQNTSYQRGKPFWHYWKNLQHLGQELQNRPFINLNEARFSEVKKGLNQVAYNPKQANLLSREEIQYFVGGWWEEYLYHSIKNQLQLDKNSIGLNIEINKDKSKRFSAGNEFDIVFVYENKFYVIECKTGIYDIKKTGMQTFNEYVYKLAALRRFFGLGVVLSLCILQKLPQSTDSQIFFKDRTEVLNIKLFDGNDFKDIQSFLEKLLR